MRSFHLAAAVTSALLWSSFALGAENGSRKRIELLPSENDRTTVQYLIEVGGDLIFEQREQKTRRKLSVVAELEYDELRLDGSDGPIRTLRRYSKAEAAIKIDDGGRKTQLRPACRLIGVELEGSKTTLYSPEGALTRAELDLIETVADSPRLEGLLPDKPVAVGDKWKLSKEFVAGFLDLDAVVKSEITCEVTEITEEVVRFQFGGDVEGATLGVVTQLEVNGKYRFDRRLRTIDWLGLLVKEERPMGHVTHGLDVVARIQLRVLPSTSDEAFAEEAISGMTLGPTPERTRLLFEAKHANGKLEHDRRWHANVNQPDLAVFRLLDNGKFLAQCNVSPLDKVAPGKQATLESFQREIELMLDDQAGKFLDAAQWASDKDYRILRTTVLGEADGSPIQWRYYLVTDRHGHQASFAFTVQPDLAEELGEMDRQFVESFTFTAPEVALKEEADSSEETK